MNSDENAYIPRDDYAEMLKLCIFYLNRGSFPDFSFRRPGAQHRARWMSAPIYALKMLLLQEQLDIEPEVLDGLQRFGQFVAIFYAPYWFECPLASEAALNDLQFFNRMLKYKNVDDDIASAAISAFNRHLWYLTEELVPFALCSKKNPPEDKERFAALLYKYYQKNRKTVSIPQKPSFPKINENTTLYHLVGERSVIVFNRLNFTVDDIQFLKYSSKKWPEFESFRRFQKVVGSLKVTNDVAERGVRLMEEYKDILTHDPDQRNMILHCVEKARKSFPDFSKTTLSKQLFE